jgi:Lar family restriction alleviation protein
VSGHTPGPWAWFGNAKNNEVYLATVNRGRTYVMGFDRWGMRGAQPTFQPEGRGLVPASKLLMFEVGDKSVRGVEAAKTDESVYRLDISGIDCADARLIAAAPEMVSAGQEALLLLLTLGHGQSAAANGLRAALARATVSEGEGRMTTAESVPVTGELLPCPFCGATDSRLVQAFTRATDDFAFWSVECLDCGAEIADDESQEAADRHWNTRLATRPTDEKLRERVADLEASVIAFGAPWAVSYARDYGLPDGHLHPTHYDILQSAGARMDDFTRAALTTGADHAG